MTAGTRRAPSDWFWSELDRLRQRWDVLQHPFYVRWTSRKLAQDELARYAEEYDHLVLALAERSRQVAAKATGRWSGELANHAAVEKAHIDLWRKFAGATGWSARSAWSYGADPFPETSLCAATWAGGAVAPLGEDLVALYAIEAPQPLITTAKLAGLLERYGFDHGAATEYQRVLPRADVAHAALARAALDELAAPPDLCRLISQAETIHRTYWGMLDSLEKARPA
jgi:pyrroloquinoline quinone (PQQ) biosynthesis protein C